MESPEFAILFAVLNFYIVFLFLLHDCFGEKENLRFPRLIILVKKKHLIAMVYN